jgi:adenylate cyclase
VSGRAAARSRRARLRRVTAHIIDAATEHHLWGDSFEGSATALFELQDRVVDGVLHAVLLNIRSAEIERARRKRPADLNAYGLAMRSFPLVFAANPDATRRALELLHLAMEEDPDYALATALAAWCHAQLVMHNGTNVLAEERRQALQLADRAGILDADDPLVLTARCAVHTMARELDVADALLARALALDPISAWAWERSGWLKAYSGEPEGAIEALVHAIQLDRPGASNVNRFTGIGSAHFDAGRYEEGAAWMTKALSEQPKAAWVERTLAVSYARLGERAAALNSLDRFRRYCPDGTIRPVVNSIPFRPDFLDRLGNGLSDLGLSL